MLAITGLVTAGAMRAFTGGLDFERRLRTESRAEVRRVEMERRIADLISRAELSTDATDNASFFVGEFTEGVASGTGAAGETAGADSLTFTATGTRVPANLLGVDPATDFTELNRRFGPQGGRAEVSLSLTGIDAPSDDNGLFLRIQRPSDGDPTQGGLQSLMHADVREIQFEFFDGNEWRPDWDTRSTTPGRLPAAVRVRYRLDDEDNLRTFTVPIPASDVTPLNPITAGGDQ